MKFLLIVLCFILIPFSFAQDQDTSDIWLPKPTSSGINIMKNGIAWNLIVDKPTVSDCDITTITAVDKVGNEIKIIAQTTSLTNTTAKAKAKQIAKDIMHESGLQGTPIDAVASNNVVLITPNTGYMIDSVDFTNDTKQKDNAIEEVTKSQYIGFDVAIRFYEPSAGKNAWGENSIIKIGLNGMAKIFDLEKGSTVLPILLDAENWLNDHDVETYVGTDKHGGQWLIYHVPKLIEGKIYKSSVIFGNTDLNLKQSVYTMKKLFPKSGGVVNIKGFEVVVF